MPIKSMVLDRAIKYQLNKSFFHCGPEKSILVGPPLDVIRGWQRERAQFCFLAGNDVRQCLLCSAKVFILVKPFTFIRGTALLHGPHGPLWLNKIYARSFGQVGLGFCSPRSLPDVVFLELVDPASPQVPFDPLYTSSPHLLPWAPPSGVGEMGSHLPPPHPMSCCGLGVLLPLGWCCQSHQGAGVPQGSSSREEGSQPPRSFLEVSLHSSPRPLSSLPGFLMSPGQAAQAPPLLVRLGS